MVERRSPKPNVEGSSPSGRGLLITNIKAIMTVVSKENNTQATTSKKKKDKNQEPTFKESLKTYFKGVKSEWHKITWPDRQQITYETIIVIAVTAFITILIALIDTIYNYILTFSNPVH